MTTFQAMEYSLETFQRSNQDTSLTHKPLVFENSWIQSGDVLTDCSSSVGGELSLGQNLLIAYMPWEGYNFEDAILISERLVIDDLYTSVHIERYDIETFETKLGIEEITRNIPDISEKELENLDSFGIIKTGSWVKEGDILVGKITPINKKNISPYQKLLYTILEKPILPIRDSSLRAPKGIHAKVIDIKYFLRKNASFSRIDLKKKKLKNLRGQKSSLFAKQKGKADGFLNDRLKNLQREGFTNLDQAEMLANLKSSPASSLIKNPLKSQKNFLVSNLKSSSYFFCNFNFLKQINTLFLKSQQKRKRLSYSPFLKQFSVMSSLSKSKASFSPNLPLSNKLGLNSSFLKKEKNGNKIERIENPGTKKLHSKFPEFSKNSLFRFRKFPLRDLSYYSGLSKKLSTQMKLFHPLVPKASTSKIEDFQNSSIFEQSKNKRWSKKSKSLLNEQSEVFLNNKRFLTENFNIEEKRNFHQKNQTLKNIETIHIYLAEKRKIQVGDKMAGRHGNKGIVSQILPIQDMPYLPDGTPVDMVLNPLGVPSRMNVGQIYECLLGLAGKYLGEHYKVYSFDEIYGSEASRSFVFQKLYEARLKTNFQWLFNPNFPGKIRIYDGRTGESFDQLVTVGQAYILRLVHMVDDKIHMRSTGPYSLVTQQPLRGRSKQGGQRLGEMEVWALEGYGAAFTLLEMLTIKSDDMTGRMTLWSNLILNKDISIGTPESFKVLICELQALCLDIGLFRYHQNPSFQSKNRSFFEPNKEKAYLKEIPNLMNFP